MCFNTFLNFEKIKHIISFEKFQKGEVNISIKKKSFYDSFIQIFIKKKKILIQRQKYF